MGSEVTEFPSVHVAGATLTNTTESVDQPTIWIVKDQGTIISNSDQLIETERTDKNQFFYHLPVPVVTPTF